MSPMNLIPSMLCIRLYFSLLFSSSSPTRIFSDAENTEDGNTSTIKGLMFVFGDSLVDNGNNNFLETVIKADYLPYGMDFPNGPSGSPGIIAAQVPRRKGCNKILNEAVQLFNAKLRSLVNGLSRQVPGPNIVMVNAYKIIQDIIRNPAANGFSDATKPCCQLSSTEEGGNEIYCKKGGATCEDRNKFVYFDGLYPTEAVNVVLAKRAFSSNLTTDVYPFGIKELAQM
ncbi:hypothetical protein POM88_037954 [Heracleum sosnowskyi]|uniref:GDSL esterase/lipase n=1 Tax=Heracleum sosnowskyi TaxID=360622 RepID=A0AAD8HSW1_9APIA|nr:hypothetical protein POM88_037954 [Heracleum sosnowskyi]